MPSATKKTIRSQCEEAKSVYRKIGMLSSKIKNMALDAMASQLLKEKDFIFSANQKDLENAKKNSLTPALIDRLRLTPTRLQGCVDAIQTIRQLKDPINDILDGWELENGLKISKIRVPLGVIGIIYEARPNVTVDAIALAIKSGNALVLRGSASAYHSNYALTQVLKKAAKAYKIPVESIQLLENIDRDGVKEMVQLDDCLDLVIPRGGAQLIETVVRHATVPSIETGTGNCHVYVDESACLTMALDICVNAKTQRPSVCNACETILVHESVAPTFMPKLWQALKDKHVELRGCEQAKEIIPTIRCATENDWSTEYLDLIVAVKIVPDIELALAHISRYSSLHSECIVAQDYTTIQYFKRSIDAAAVLVNASTRFTDGGVFGFGAEMGISTQKLHARGPLGLSELSSYKYIIEGDGQIR